MKVLVTPTTDMRNTDKYITMNHGSGGRLSQRLIEELFLKYFSNDTLRQMPDASLFNSPSKNLAISTDSFVVDPIFFPGGDIGKLAVCGTVNDLAVSGAHPMVLSCGFILEEGLELSVLEKIIQSMAVTAALADVQIIAGDTKVVPKGKCDKVFINTTGVGWVEPKNKTISSGIGIKEGDKIIVNGPIAEHGMAIMNEREQLNFKSDCVSDCACLNALIESTLSIDNAVLFMRDATRGGLATVLCELSERINVGMELVEEQIPITDSTKALCDILGFDPLYVANEGKVVMIVASNKVDVVLGKLHEHPLGKKAQIIGSITSKHRGRIYMETSVGGKRIVDVLTGDQLPRIC